ncbi:561_t:CDS:2 [Scutellospora calospora]|uniref:561_t:CDS:1 n=1 Tax=Scutellospora calospora TaxID=85575 RepID=A0ACA9L4C1_9GLOM|nr:561_t:CDS:2 [Scutellospora calospora]
MAATTDDIMNYLKANISGSLLLKDSKRKRDILPGFLYGVVMNSKQPSMQLKIQQEHQIGINSEAIPAFYLMQMLEEKIYTIDDSKFNINEELTKEQQEQASQFLTNNIDIFSENILKEEQFKQLGQTNIICHEINTDKARPIKQ